MFSVFRNQKKYKTNDKYGDTTIYAVSDHSRRFHIDQNMHRPVFGMISVFR